MRRLSRGTSLAIALAATPVALGALLVPPPATAAPPSSQDQSDDLIAVSIDSISPAVPTATDTLTLTGRISNRSAEVISDVEVGLRVSPTPLVGRGELTDVIAGNTDRIGERVANTLTRVDDALTPGESKPFRLTVAMSKLALPQPGSYVTAVEALGNSLQPSNMMGLGRTFLPWFPAGSLGGSPTKPLRLVLGWPLAAAPSRDAAGVFLNEDVPASMASGGRLDRILKAGATHKSLVSFILDPDLIEAADMASRGYSVASAEAPTPGTHASAAEGWVTLARAAIGTAEQSALALPAGVPDMVAWRRAKLTPYLRETVTPPPSLPVILGRQVPGRTAITAVGNYPDRTIEAMHAIGFKDLIASEAAFPPVEGGSASPTGRGQVTTPSGDLNLLLYDEGLRAALDMPTSTPEQSSLAVQRILADTLLAALEPADAPRTLFALPDLLWDPSEPFLAGLMSSLRAAGWLGRADLEDLRAEKPVERVRADYTAEQIAAETPAETMARIARSEAAVTQADAVVLDGATPPANSSQVSIGELRRGLLRSGSSLWAKQRPQGKDLVARVSDQATTRFEAVRVVSTGNVLFSGNRGTIPITIENGLDVPARVGLALSGNPPVSFNAEPLEAFTIEPGMRTTREVSAEVVGGGEVVVNIQLTTSEGTPYGKPSTATIRSTAYSRAAAWVIGASFAALVVLVLVNGIRRRVRSRHADQTDTDQTDTGHTDTGQTQTEQNADGEPLTTEEAELGDR